MNMNKKELLQEVKAYRERKKSLINYLSIRTENELISRRSTYQFTISSYNYEKCRVRHTEGAGIYLFEAEFSNIYKSWELSYAGSEKDKMISWFSLLKQLWESVEFSPLLYLNRAKEHYSYINEFNRYKNGFIPLYLGKSKNVFERIQTHYDGFYDGTYGLRLKERIGFRDLTLQVSSSALWELGADDLYPLVSEVEKELRRKMNPISGKQ